MNFSAASFIFNGIPSEQYNLYMGSINDNGEYTGKGSDITPITQKLFRRPNPLLYGVEQTPVNSFPVSIYSPTEIDAQSYSLISKWLFGQQQYQTLRICQNDLSDTFFQAFLTSPNVFYSGNQIKSLSTTVVCDSPFAYKSPKTYDYDYSSVEFMVSETIIINNESANNFYTYPTDLTITANVFGGSVTIINTTDNNRLFGLSLSANEVVTINCDTQVITSTIETYPIANLTDKNFLRLLPGYNYLNVVGNISALDITIPCAVKIGG